MHQEDITEHYEPGDRVTALVEDEWRPGIIDYIESYTVRNNETGRHRDISPDVIRGNDGAIRIGDQIEFRQSLSNNSWAPGTIVGINYWINMTDFIGGFYEVSHIDIRRRVEEPEPELEPELEPEPGPQPIGSAYEVHNEFDTFKANKWDTFMKIINRTTGTNTNFKNRNAPFQPLIDYVNTSESFNENKESLTPEEKAELIRKKADIIQKINRIFTRIQEYSRYNQNIDNIIDCIQYVLMQPPDFIDAYINTFVVDCFKAYTTGDSESCIKGIYERVYLAFRDTVSTLCLDKIQGTGPAPLCKPDYIEIYDCFYDTIPQSVLNDYLKDWYENGGHERLGNLSEEDRIEDFVEFVRITMNNPARFAKAEGSIRRYANKEINVLFGGRLSSRKLRKTVKRRQNSRSRNKKTVKKRKNKIIKKQSGSKKRRF